MGQRPGLGYTQHVAPLGYCKSPQVLKIEVTISKLRWLLFVNKLLIHLLQLLQKSRVCGCLPAKSLDYMLELSNPLLSFQYRESCL